MKFEGQVSLNASAQKIWSLVSNPEQVASCFPGLKDMTKVSENEYKITGATGIGFIKGEYKATVKLNILQPMKEVNLVSVGSGLNSNVNINADIQIADNLIKYSVDIKPSGVIATIGARLIDTAFERIIKELIDCFKMKAEA